MSVSDGQDASATVLNSAYVSKTADSDVTSKLNLNSTDAASGDDISDVQLAINQLRYKTYANEAISAGGEITSTTLKGLQARRVSGSGAARTASTTPFGSTGGWEDGTVIRLIGTHDTNTLSITSTDSAKGAVLNGSTITLKKDDILDLQYDSSRDRWIEVGRNTTNTVLGGDLSVEGNIVATGDITANGDITLGDANTDTIDVIGDLTVKAGNGLIIEDDSGDDITITAPASIDAPYTLTLPANDGNADQVLTTNGSGTLEWSNSSGGGTGKNYISNSSCASSVITPWAAYADAAATTAADGTGGSATVTITANTSSPLSDDSDFLITKDAANRQGEGVASVFTIDVADKAKKMTISFDYTTSANYADDDIKIFVYDVTNTNLIRVNGEDLKAVSGTGKHYAQFQTASDSVSYRLIFHCSSTNASAYTVNFDTAHVGPQQISHGAIATDWVDYTSSSTWSTNASAALGKWRRVGDSMEVQIRQTYTGATSTVALTCGLPSGYSVDSTKVMDAGAGGSIFGTATGKDLALQHIGIVTTDSDDGKVRVYGDDGVGQWTQDSGNEVPFVIASGDEIVLRFSVPIQGWSANAKMSEDFSGRDVVVNLDGLSAATTVTVPSGTTSNITKISAWNTATLDTTSSWSHANQKWTCPETGIYDIKLNVMLDGETVSGVAGSDYQKCKAFIYKDGSAFKTYDQDQYGTQTNISSQVQHTCEITKGTEIEFYVQYFGGSNVDASNTMAEESAVTFASIAKRPSAQTILENETVAFKVYNAAGNTDIVTEDAFNVWDTTHSDALTGTELFDTHGAWNNTTGVYTVPVTGIYQINAAWEISGMTQTGIQVTYKIRANDNFNHIYNTHERQQEDASGASGAYTYSRSTIAQLTKGDTIVQMLDLESDADDTGDLSSTAMTFEFSMCKIK